MFNGNLNGFRLAKLVQITPIIMVYGRYIELVNGLINN